MGNATTSADVDGPLDQLCSHIVSLSWLDARVASDGSALSAQAYDPRAFAISAFVISVRGVWFLVTAGHILHDLSQRLNAGRRIIKSRLMDGLAPGPHLPPVVFALSHEPEWYVDTDDRQDYGLIPLRPLYATQLAAGGVIPLAEPAWTDIPEQADLYFLLGFPKQAKRIDVSVCGHSGNVALEIGTPLLPVQRIQEPPAALRSTTPRLYARVPIGTGTVNGREITLTDLDGMSGGPVFAVKQQPDGRWRLWVVAVQSSWVRESRVLAACYIRPLIDGIERCLDRHHQELTEFEGPAS